jgi:discoidin domain receptor family protein 2
MIAKHVRLNLKQIKKFSCIQFELFGCIFTDGVVSYSMLQGSKQLEDDTYDGRYDEKQRYLYGKKKRKYFIIKKNIYFYYIDGLGQLSDGQTGPDNREDPGGFQWVSYDNNYMVC